MPVVTAAPSQLLLLEDDTAQMLLDVCLLHQAEDICDFTYHINGQQRENATIIDFFLL